MNNKPTVRVLRAFAGRWLSKAETDTKRNLRKLVEFGSYFSSSAQIKNFFIEAHNILKSSISKYYILARSLIRSVDRERITEFGISFGYYGFVKGMREISSGSSEIENSRALAGIIGNDTDNHIDDSEDLQYRISESAQNGAAMYFIFCDEICLHADEIGNVMKCYPHNAFFLLTGKADIALSNNQLNAMPILNFESECFSATCEKLKNQKRLFGAYCIVNDDNMDEVLSSDLLDKVQEAGVFFLFLIKADGCSDSLSEKANGFGYAQKRKPTHPIFVTELLGDLEWLNSVSGKIEH